MIPNLMRTEQVRATMCRVAYDFYENAFEYADVVVYDEVNSGGAVTWPSAAAKNELIEKMTSTFVALEWRGANNNRGYGSDEQKLMSFGEDDKRYVVYGLDMSTPGEAYHSYIDDSIGYLFDEYGLDVDTVVSHINDLRGIAFKNVMFSDCDFSRTHFENCSLQNVDVMFSDVMEDASLASRAPLSFDRCSMNTSLIAVQDDITDDYRETHELTGGELGVVDGNGNASVLHIKDVFEQSDINDAARKAASDYSFTDMVFHGEDDLRCVIFLQGDGEHMCELEDVKADGTSLNVCGMGSVDAVRCNGTMDFDNCGEVLLRDSRGGLSFDDNDTVSLNGCELRSALFGETNRISFTNSSVGRVFLDCSDPVAKIEAEGSDLRKIDVNKTYDNRFDVRDVRIVDSYLTKFAANSNIMVSGDVEIVKSSLSDMSGRVVLSDDASMYLSNVAALGERLSLGLQHPEYEGVPTVYIRADEVSDGLLSDIYWLGDSNPGRVDTELSGTNIHTLPPHLETPGIDLSGLFDELDEELGISDDEPGVEA